MCLEPGGGFLDFRQKFFSLSGIGQGGLDFLGFYSGDGCLGIGKNTFKTWFQVSGSRFQVSGSRFQVSALPSRVAAGGCAGGLGFDFCVGWRHAPRSEWPSFIFILLY